MKNMIAWFAGNHVAANLLMIFLLLNGHHFVLEALQLSYAAVPIGAFSVSGEVTQMLIRLAGHAFVIAKKPH